MTCGIQPLVMCLQNLCLADTVNPRDLQVLYQVCVLPVGPEPFFGVSRHNMRRKIKRWMENQHLVFWHDPCTTQARELISGPDLAKRPAYWT